MVLRLVRVDENVPVCKAVFPEGTNYVGRGKLLDCEDKRVSRKHGELYVMDECIFIKSLHSKNPCFIKKKNSNDLIVVNYEERFPLNNGDRVGFLPDNYWYEIRISPSLNATQCKVEQNEGSVASVNRMNTEPLDFDDQTQLAGAINPPVENNESTHSETETHPESSLKRPHEYETPPRKNVKKEPVTPKQTPTKNTPSLNGTASIEPNPLNDETISDTNISKETTDKPTTSKKQVSAKNKKKPKKTYNYTNETLRQALYDIRNCKISLTKVAKQYNIPKTTLYDRLSEKCLDVIMVGGGPSSLDQEFGKNIVVQLKDLSTRGFIIKKVKLIDAIQTLVKGSTNPCRFKDGRPSIAWVTKFLKRHPEIGAAQVKQMTDEQSVTEESLRSWFNMLQSYLDETNHTDILESPHRIFNASENMFPISASPGKIFVWKECTKHEKANVITALVIVNANAQICPPLIVFPHKTKVSTPHDCFLVKTERGMILHDTFNDYIVEDFDNWLVKNNIKKPVLVLLDGYALPTLTLELSGACQERGIILYALPPKTSNILNPANISIFGYIKTNWKKLVDDFVSTNEDNCIAKNFCNFFGGILRQYIVSFNIIDEFIKCGIYPLDPDSNEYYGKISKGEDAPRTPLCRILAKKNKNVQLESNKTKKSQINTQKS